MGEAMYLVLNYIYLKKTIQDTELVTTEEREIKKSPQKGKIRYLCKKCKTLITWSTYKINVKDKFIHVCANPHGIIFEIGCFSYAQNYVPVDSPTLEFTWFPGYAWQIILCANCLTHLGWLYLSDKDHFWGLILKNLIEDKRL